MIRNTAYDTAACQGFMMNKTLDALKEAAASGTLGTDSKSTVLLVDGRHGQEKIPAFSHPLQFELPGARESYGYKAGAADHKDIVLDIRGFGRWNADQHQYEVRNKQDHDQAMVRARMNSVWINNDPMLLKNLSPVPMLVFASWVSESVSRKYHLNPGEQYKLQLLAAHFYLCQFEDDIHMDQNMVLRNVRNISQNLRVDGAHVMDVIEAAGHVETVADFCNRAKEITQSVQLDGFSPGILFMIVTGTWYGSNSREIAAVALEHPPTWVTVCLAAMTERAYRNSAISKIAERHTNKDTGRDFMKSAVQLLEHF